jgi:FlaG/FlaF family flagellin (archaellin)
MLRLDKISNVLNRKEYKIKKHDNKMKTKKKGVSPVVAMVLLIALVVVIGLIIFLWFKGMTKEAVTKFEGENIELACSKVKFDAEYNEGKLSMINKANVAIADFKVKRFFSGGHEEISLEDDSNFKGLGQTKSDEVEIDFDSGTTKIIIIPVLRGYSEAGVKDYKCEESQGVEIEI